ncbi:MAG: 4Fe-4S dicluster domain-containing protein [Thermodesulfobacteriota bacterium]
MLILKNIDKFLALLNDGYEFIDVSKGGLPPKEYFFPPEETTFTFETKDGLVSTPPSPRPFVLYGLSIRDLAAIRYLDEIMSTPERDFYYFRRRNRALLVGVAGERFDVPPGGDIILAPLSAGAFRIQAVTVKGEKVIKKYLPRLKKSEDARADLPESETMAELRRLLMDAELIKDAVEWSWKGYPRLWEKLSAECMGCGICTYVCPLCHCFSMEDSIDLSGELARRCRKWDACTLPGFAKLGGGGGDLHPGLKERYYNWFFHKFVRAYTEFGRAQCVACGRCQRECPARIDIESVLLDIVARYEKERKRQR